MMKPRRIAVADEDECARACFQHEREVLTAHQRRRISIDAIAADHVSRNGCCELSLLGVIARHRIVAGFGGGGRCGAGPGWAPPPFPPNALPPISPPPP